ncbi:MAG: hypothetical protein HQL99_13590 [Magnetococcales bacterium]|nr:hypothetical protein [Magnetococcales bacterium]
MIDETRRRFDEHLEELGSMIILNLLTAFEGHVRADFESRVRRRKKDPVSQAYRQVETSLSTPGRVQFEKIFEIWKNDNTDCKTQIGRMKGFWHYRNWLAHGRWWVTQSGPAPVAENVKRSIEEVLICLDISFA